MTKGKRKMTTRKMAARLIHIKIEEGKTGLFYATSPDLKGLLVAERTIPALLENIPKCITNLFMAKGVEVIVTNIEDHDDNSSRPWVAIPCEVAKHALECA